MHHLKNTHKKLIIFQIKCLLKLKMCGVIFLTSKQIVASFSKADFTGELGKFIITYVHPIWSDGFT
jgi:hypothetical protein